MRRRQQKIQLSDIYPHGWFFRTGACPPHHLAAAINTPISGSFLAIQEPARVINRHGRRKKNDTSIKRLPFQFKLIQGKQLKNRVSSTAKKTDPHPLSAIATAPSPSSAPLPSVPPATAKRRVRGPDSKPRKKRGTGKIQEAPQAQTGAGAGNTVGMEQTVVTERALAAVSEAAVDADVAAGRW